MNTEGAVYSDISFRFPKKHLINKLKLEAHPDLLQEFNRIYSEAVRIANPKVTFRPLLIEARGEGFIVLEGTQLKSAILASQLVSSKRVHVFTATCGAELDTWSAELSDPLEQYWAHELLGIALERAMRHLRRQLIARYQIGHLSTIDPGSTADWPLEGQAFLFQLLGDLPAKIGVSLQPHYTMKPAKSASGIMFSTSQAISRCSLCDLELCSERGRPFDPSLFADQAV